MKPPHGRSQFSKLCQRLITFALVAGLSTHVFAVNPKTANPGGKSSGESEESSDLEEEPSDEGKDCDGTESETDDSSSGDDTSGSGDEGDCPPYESDSNPESDDYDDDDDPSECDEDSDYPDTPSCIQEKIPLAIAPNEPGLGVGILKIYIDSTGPNWGSREHLDFFGLPQMSITSAKTSGSKTDYEIVQAASTLIPFKMDSEVGSVGFPMGASAYSQARLSFIGAGGAPAAKSTATAVRQQRAAQGFCDYPVGGGKITRYETKEGRIYNFPLSGMEVIREKADGTLVVNGNYGTGSVRQVKTVAGLLDVVVLSERSYEVRKYAPNDVGGKVNGIYTTLGSPHMVLKVEAPANTYNRLTITKSKGSWNSVSNYFVSTSNGEEVWRQVVSSGSLTYERVLKRKPLTNLGPDYQEITRSATLTSTPPGVGIPSGLIAAGGGGVSYLLTAQTYKFAPSTSSQTSNNGATHIRNLSRDDQPLWDMNGVGRPTSKTDRRGGVATADYDTSNGRMQSRSMQYGAPAGGGGSGPAIRTQQLSYTAHGVGETVSAGDFRPRTTTTTIDGVTTGKQFFSAQKIDGVYVETKERTRGAIGTFGALGNLKKQKTWVGTGAHVGRIQKELAEDGTLTRYEYAEKPDNGLEKISYKRLTSEGNAVVGYSSRIKELRDARGWPVTITYAEYVNNAWLDYETIHQTFDSAGNLTLKTRQDVFTNQVRTLLQQEWDGPLLTRRVNEEGVATAYEYFPGTKLVSVERREAVPAQESLPAQPEIVTTYTGDFTINAKQVPVWQKRITTITSAGSTLTEEHSYDSDNRVISHTDFNGYTTNTVYSDMDKVITETFPDNSTRITTKNSKGLILSITGTAVVAKYFHHEPLEDGSESMTVYTGVDEGPRYETTIKDNLKRVSKVIKPAFGGGTEVTEYAYSLTHPNSVTQVTSSGQANRICELNTLGVCERLGYTADNGTLELDSYTDRITDTQTTTEHDINGLWKVTRKSVYSQANSGLTNLVVTTRTKLGGFSGTEIARRETVDIADNVTVQTTLLSGYTREERLSRPGVTGDEISVYQADRLTHVFSPGITNAVIIGYDGFGREISRKQPRHTQPSWTNYASGSNLIASQTDAAGNSSTYSYYPQGVTGAGKVKSTMLADNSVQFQAYTLRGETMVSWGSQTYPTWKQYDDYGQLIHLYTWQTAPPLNVDSLPATRPVGFATTTWNYDASTGLLSSKRDDSNKGADYTYDVARRLSTRHWARTHPGTTNRILTQYYWNAFNQPTSIDYADATPDVSMAYDRLGRLTQRSNGHASSDFVYDESTLLIDTETISYDLDGGGVDFTRVLDRSQDTYLRNSGFQLKDGSTVENEAEYRYDSAGRYGEVEGPGGTFTYGYRANSDLIGSVTGPTHTVTNTWEENRDILDTKTNQLGSIVISNYNYEVNPIGQREGVTTAFDLGGGLPANPGLTAWGYDGLGQVTSADHDTNGALDRAYQYDAIGNRRFSEISNTQISDPATANTTGYTPDSLNQYDAINPYNADGTAGTPVEPVFDDDGNMEIGLLSGTGGSSANHLKWDAENRLVEVRAADDTTIIATYFYDAQSRRIAKTTGSNTTVFLYDDWNSIAEYYGTTLARTFTWGLDLSDSLQGAGGVGGLLAVKQGSAIHYPAYDGNGNVSEYLTTAGAVAAHFEYDPFGNTLVNTDSSEIFSYRFSTKPMDFETGLCYYGYRYYDPVTGRWPSRDPIWEITRKKYAELLHEGPNLYSFGKNGPTDGWDFLGQEWGGLRFPFANFDIDKPRDCDKEEQDCLNRGRVACQAYGIGMAILAPVPPGMHRSGHVLCAIPCFDRYKTACETQKGWCQQWNREHGF